MEKTQDVMEFDERRRFERELRDALNERYVLLQKDGTIQKVFNVFVNGHGNAVLQTDTGQHFLLTSKVSLEYFRDGKMAKCAPVSPRPVEEILTGICLLPEGWRTSTRKSKPALAHEWQKRWWEFYNHFITADGTRKAADAAALADEAIEVARKHLEGEE